MFCEQYDLTSLEGKTREVELFRYSHDVFVMIYNILRCNHYNKLSGKYVKSSYSVSR